MAAETKKEIELEIAHVLFLDIVGYSKLSVNEQHARIQELNEIVRLSEQFQKAEAANRIIKIPTGDGMALVFYKSPEEPAQCAFEISRALKDNPRLQIRMGIHSGPISGVVDVNERTNVAGGGINMAQRVMDCGDAGHILLSHHVAEDLGEYDKWRPLLHNLGECEVKHGARISVINLYTEEVGNPAVPGKLRAARLAAVADAAKRKRVVLYWTLFTSVVLLIAIAAIGFFSFRYGSRFALTPLVVPEKSIAVLPFENLSEEKANAFFADGVQDEILSDLARVADLRVISRTSTMFYKAGNPRNLRQIAQQLGVAHVVEGSVQRAANRVRVNAQLIDARTDKHLWGQTYDRDLSDIFAIQSEIARTIADQLQAKLSSNEKSAIERPPATDVAAFDLYTRAKNILAAPDWSEGDLLQAVELLNQAVAHDPSFFDAYCQLAFTHDWIYFQSVDHTPARLALAEAAIQAAARLRPDAGETHAARAQHLYYGYFNYDGALAELEIARQALPNDFRVPQLMSYIQRRQGRWEECIQSLERAVELNPREIKIRAGIAVNYTFLRRYADLKSALVSTLAVFPNDLDTRYWLTYVEFQEKADTQPLHQMIDSIRATNPTPTPNIAEWWLACALAERDTTAAKSASDAEGKDGPFNLGKEVSFTRSFVEGLIARMRKDEGKAQSAFVAARAEQQKAVEAYPNDSEDLGLLGLIDAYLGRKEEALREGRRAVELVAKDPVERVNRIANLAMIAACIGDKDLAFEQLESIIRRPSPLNYGGLKLFPWWDPLRGDPRFEKLVEEAKEPVALK
jgi:TolB-like protein/class 3 adenylate cyclase/Flp pilus assembly protein TadD